MPEILIPVFFDARPHGRQVAAPDDALYAIAAQATTMTFESDRRQHVAWAGIRIFVAQALAFRDSLVPALMEKHRYASAGPRAAAEAEANALMFASLINAGQQTARLLGVAPEPEAEPWTPDTTLSPEKREEVRAEARAEFDEKMRVYRASVERHAADVAND